MTRLIYTACAIILCLDAPTKANPPEAHLPEIHREFFNAYCLDCHNSDAQEGKVDLETLSFHITTVEQAERWQKVLNTINAGEMPPEDSEQPGKIEKADLLDDLAQTMVTARQVLSDSGGKITMRRLNRREYSNTIKQLTGAIVDVGTLPVDGGSGTFDTVGTGQFMSSDQFEQYLKLGRVAIDEAFERQAATGQKVKVFRVEPENTVNVRSRKNMAQQAETQERYLQWKAEVDRASLLPENKEVMEQLREKYKLDDLTDSIKLYQNANSLKGVPDAQKFGFRDANAASFSFQGGYGRTHAYMKHYLELPNSDRGTYLKLAWAIQRIDVLPDPADLPPGTYKLSIRAGTVEGSDPSRHFVEIGHPQRVNQVPAGFSGKPLASLHVTGTEHNPEIIETTLVIGSKTPREFGIQERRPEGNQKALSREFYAYKRENGYGTPPAIWVDWIELKGPLSTERVVETRAHRVEPENTVNVKNEEITKRLEDNYEKKWLPWKEGVDKAVAAAENREVVAALRKKHPDYDSSPVLKYQKAGLLKGAPDPRDYGGSDPINAIAALYSPYQRYHSYMKHYAELPHNDRGAYLKLSRGVQRFDIRPNPKEVPPGTYKLRIRAGVVKGSDPSRHFIAIGHPQTTKGASRGFAKLLSTQPISGTIENPEIIELNVEIGANTPREFGIQERERKSEKLIRQAFDRHKKENGYGTPPAIWVDWIELEGPITEAAATESMLVRVEPEKTINPANEKEIAQIEDSYARFTRWQQGVDKAAATPENQARMAKFRKTEPKAAHPVWSYGFADRLEGTPNPKDFGFRDAQKAAASHPENDRANLAYHKHYAALPHRDRGTYLKVAHGTGRIIVPPEKKELPPGSYVMRVRVGAAKGTPASRRFIQVGHPQRLIESRNWGLEGPAISTHQVTGTIENPETIEIPLEITSNTIREFAVQEKQPNNGNLKALWDAHDTWKKKNGYGHPPAIWIDWVELEGPHAVNRTTATQSPLQAILARYRLSESRQDDRQPAKTETLSEFHYDESEAERARAILTEFAKSAFRNVSPESDYIDRLVSICQTRLAAGDPFGEAIRTPLSVILASPRFLYLSEPGDEGVRRQLNDRELAVRLSYFLWSGPPDEELLQFADENKLHLPATLRQQVDRLIADPRSDEFVAGFVHQWLDMERLDFFQFDVNLHRDFDESTRSAAREEVYQSFAHLLRDSGAGRISKLLKSDYVFVNGLLATYYGIEGVTGDEFRKIKLPAESPRGGLLGMAAIHAMGSDGVVSSPVERGAWVLRHLLNDPPPPAPPNVPQISRLEGQILTTRDRLLAHQEEAQCASCHRKIDPIGFGLENFNATGKWRTEDSYQARDERGRGVGKRKTWAIDASGAFYKGPKFNDYRELRDLIAEREEDFARGFTEHLIEYALGRPFGFTDEELAAEIVQSASSKELAISELIHALVQSQVFRTK